MSTEQDEAFEVDQRARRALFREARADIAGHLFGPTAAPLTYGEMGRLLRLHAANPATAARDLERGKARIGGPMVLALELLTKGREPVLSAWEREEELAAVAAEEGPDARDQA